MLFDGYAAISQMLLKSNFEVKIEKEVILKVLVIGSAPDAIQARDWDMEVFDLVIVINNAWQVAIHWNELIFPYDFADENKPAQLLDHQKFVTEDQFVPAQNLFGGFVYAGATMAFTAGYWSLASHLPTRLCFWVAICITVIVAQLTFMERDSKTPSEMILHLLLYELVLTGCSFSLKCKAVT